MAKRSGIGARLFVHGKDLSGDVGSVNQVASSVALLDVTGLPVASPERIQGLGDGMIDYSPFFNDATGQSHEELSALPTTDRVVAFLVSVTAGEPAAWLVGKQTGYGGNRGADGSLVHTTGKQASGGVPLEWGINLTAGQITHASASDETGIDNSAQTTAGGVGVLEHFDADSGTVEYDIEDSSDSTDGDDGTWGNLLAFSDVATPYTAVGQRVTVTGAVERWVRASTNGTFTNADFWMGFRRGAANDREDLS